MKKFLLLVPFSLLFFAVSCRSVEENPAPVQANSFTSSGEAVGGRMLDAFDSGNYRDFAGCIPPELAKEFDSKAFEAGRKQVCDRAGTLKSHRFLGVLTGPVFHNFLWAASFERKNSEGKLQTQELLFKVTAAETDGKCRVVSFGFLF